MKNASDHKNFLCERFKKDIHSIFGDELRSLILFGSGATEEYRPERSDLNFIVVLGENAIRNIRHVQSHVARWRADRISLPLFVTEKYIKESLDTFPIEFLNMQTAYQVLEGEDVLKGLKFRKEHIRLQCERELKGNLLKLRQGFIRTRGRSRELKGLISDSIISFVSLFRAILFLKDRQVPSNRQEAVLAVCREFKLDEGLFSILFSIHADAAKIKKSRMAELAERYIEAVEEMTGQIN